MPNWTDDQKKAIELRESNLLVSAAAGSGKTAVLVERIIRLITEDMIDIDRLLIVTFTNAAAGEMRERILKAISLEIEKGVKNEEHLRRQLTLLNKASITTIHSFCINIVRQNFHLIDIDPAFRIGDATEKNIIIHEVLDDLMENEYEKGDENFLKLVEGFGTNREDVKLQELILRIYFFIQSKPYPEKWLKECVEQFNITKDEFEKSKWVKTIKDSIRIELNGANALINEAIKLCRGINGPIEYEEALINDLTNIEGLLRSLDISMENFYKNIIDFKHQKFKSIKGDRKLEVDDSKKDEVKKLRDDYKKKIIEPIKNNILTKGIDEQVSQLNFMYPTIKYLYELINSFTHMYSEKKQEKGILDFSDLEHYTLKILESEEVQKELRNKFKYIFVDEYQDSNIVQETIINRIKRENNLFLVGDVKQSIYRFRLADPSLFIEKYETYTKDENHMDIRIDLSKNFRSRFEILEGINFVFRSIMSKELGEINYDEEAYLYKGIEFEPIENPEIEVNIIEKEIENIDGIEEALLEMTNVEIEAKITAKKIKELIGKKTYKPKTGSYEDIKYRDIVILLRATKNWSPIFLETLTKEGIPVYSDDSSGYFDVIEVKIFMNLLQIIDNKRQDIPLLSAMRSPIGRFNTEELIKIRINHRIGSYYEAIEEYMNSHENELKNKLQGFLARIDRWSDEARLLKLDDFIWKLLIETGYYHYVGAMPGGIQRQANLRILVDRAGQFEKTSINGLFNFIRFIDKLAKSSGDMSTAKTIGESENVVRIMSIHKSKGLEFPVVICAGLGKQFNLRDTHQDVLLHKDLGLGPKYVDIDKRVYSETLPQVAIKKKMLLESLSEEMRILYVALTRAVDKLILVGAVKNIKKESKKWCRELSLYNLIKAKCYYDWILNVLSKHKDGEVIRKLSDATINKSGFNENEKSKWSINIIDRTDVLIEEDIVQTLKDEYKDELLNFQIETPSNNKEEIESRFNWNYNYSNAIRIPTKLSVTDIKKASAKNLDNIVFRPPSLVKMPQFIEGQKPFTSAEKGTIIHFAMQHLDLNKVYDKELIKNQIDMMVINELLTEEEAKVIDIEKIMRFFESNIGKRLLKAEKIYRETPFVVRKRANDVINGLENCDEEVLVQGIVDCYFEEEEDIVLIDYKTDYVFDGDIKNTAERYKVQLKFYKEAIERITGKKVKESYIYLFNVDEEVKINTATAI